MKPSSNSGQASSTTPRRRTPSCCPSQFGSSAANDWTQHHPGIIDGIEDAHADRAGPGLQRAGGQAHDRAGGKAADQAERDDDRYRGATARKMTIRTANRMQPTAKIVCGRLVRSASNPPEGTLNTAIHNTMLIAEPAAVIDQPCSTSRVSPKLKTMAKPTLNRPQIRTTRSRPSTRPDPAARMMRSASMRRPDFHSRRATGRCRGRSGWQP